MESCWTIGATPLEASTAWTDPRFTFLPPSSGAVPSATAETEFSPARAGGVEDVSSACWKSATSEFAGGKSAFIASKDAAMASRFFAS